MGKNRHSKDRLFITATEWSIEYGGKKNRDKSAGDLSRPLPFDHCALSLAPYSIPAVLLTKVSSSSSSSSVESPKQESSGVIFDFENIATFLLQYKSDPVTGEAMTTKNILRLNMAKNVDGKWHCPVTCKVFTNNSHMVAVTKTGNVFAYDAVLELNIKTKNFTDLLTGEPFKKSELITLQDPHNKEQMSIRDVNNFIHLKKLRDENIESRKTDTKMRHNPVAEGVMKEINQIRKTENETGVKRNVDHLMTSSSTVQMEIDAICNEDVADVLALQPLIEDVNPGQINTDGKASSSFTSSSTSRHTSNATRRATAMEIREAKWKILRQLDKKGYVQLQTSHGNLNLELHCDIAMKTCWNFIKLCEKGYYDNITFHRLVPTFMIQAGDPTGTGSGGESAFHTPFGDEFENRLTHSCRGILSMANSGPNSNTSQFFITFKECKHLDLRHTVFGKVVGGLANLDKLEAIGADKKERPKQEIRILKAEVVSSPIAEAETALLAMVRINMNKRSSKTQAAVLPTVATNNALSSAAFLEDSDHVGKHARLKL